MNNNYYQYKDEIFECKACNWRGKGKETIIGEVYAELFEIDCPNCHETITHINYPTIKDTLNYGSDEEKKKAKEQRKRISEINAMELTDIKQLPDIDKPNITFRLEVSEDLKYILLKYDNKTIWKEVRYYEYYERYLAIGKLLKMKYKNNLYDFIPSDKKDRVYFYGDCSFSYIDKIRKFRENHFSKQTSS
jgi:hypothetical protein